MEPHGVTGLTAASVLTMPHFPLPLQDYWPLVQPIMAGAAEGTAPDASLILALLATTCILIGLLAFAVRRRFAHRRKQRALAASAPTRRKDLPTMTRVSWIGWLLAALTLFSSAASGVAAPMRRANPLEGQLLHHTDGGFYVYHDGAKFELLIPDIGDQVIDAIPGASSAQWDSLFTSTPPVQPRPAPEPFPGYS
jgi:ABC-type Fe3+ transport system permease subunit